MKSPIYGRLAKLVLTYWPFLLCSSIAAIFFVFMNSLSIWLTASLINNILTDFDSIISEQKKWEGSISLNLNDSIKYFSNKLILKDTQVGSLKQLCMFIFGETIYINLCSI